MKPRLLNFNMPDPRCNQTPRPDFGFIKMLFSSGFSPGFTVLGARVLFKEYDASGIDGLWVPDGTSAGTRELTVAGSFANGVFFDVNAPDLTVFAGRRYSSARTRTAISACGSPTRRAPGAVS